MTAGEQVRAAAPEGALFYRLFHTRADGSRCWIPSNQRFLPMTSEPGDIPSGIYAVIYFAIGWSRLESADEIKIDLDSRTQTDVALKCTHASPT